MTRNTARIIGTAVLAMGVLVALYSAARCGGPETNREHRDGLRPNRPARPAGEASAAAAISASTKLTRFT